MPETIDSYEEMEFSEIQKQFVQFATDSYIRQLDSTNDPIKDKTLAMYQVIDEINKESFEKDKEKPSCFKGCSHCCHIQVTATEWEVDTILEWMKHEGLEFSDAEIKRIENQALIQSDKEYIESPHRRCVFLGHDGLCEIYPVRPSACRNYFVFSPPEDCDTYNGNASGRVLTNFNIETLAPIMAMMQKSRYNSLPKLLIEKLKK